MSKTDNPLFPINAVIEGVPTDVYIVVEPVPDVKVHGTAAAAMDVMQARSRPGEVVTLYAVKIVAAVTYDRRGEAVERRPRKRKGESAEEYAARTSGATEPAPETRPLPREGNLLHCSVPGCVKFVDARKVAAAENKGDQVAASAARRHHRGQHVDADGAPINVTTAEGAE